MPAFARRVLSVVRSIPAGRVATYGDVARLAGVAGAARAVGNIMRTCHDATVPCHRVVAAGGRLGGYGGQEALKRQLLRAEGVHLAGRRIHDFAHARWPAQSRAKPPRPRTPAAGTSSYHASRAHAGHRPTQPQATPRRRGPV
jgi:O-6-methylguanine DNA methyltransferase